MSYGRNFLQALFGETPESKMTDEQVLQKASRYLPKDIVVPTPVVRDAMKGTQLYLRGNSDVNFNDVFPRALNDRLNMRNVPQRGISFTPTGVDAFDLWNPPLVLPEEKVLTFGEYSGA